MGASAAKEKGVVVLIPHVYGRAKLDGCILGKNTKIGTKAELSRCVTQAGYEVDAGGMKRPSSTSSSIDVQLRDVSE